MIWSHEHVRLALLEVVAVGMDAALETLVSPEIATEKSPSLVTRRRLARSRPRVALALAVRWERWMVSDAVYGPGWSYGGSGFGRMPVAGSC